MNPKQKKELEDWLQKAVKRNAPAMRDSKVFLALFNDGYEKEPLACLQFGMAIVMDKPIYLAVPHGTKIPENVKRVARAIEYYDPNDPNDIKAATHLLVEKGMGEVERGEQR